MAHIEPDGYARQRTRPGTPGLLVADPVTQGRLMMWARRREKYGPSGHRPEARERVLQGVRAMRLGKLARTHCRKGLHKYTAANTRITASGSRLCLACRAIADGRRAWQGRVVDRQREQLRQEMIAVGIRMNRNPASQKLRAMFWRARQAYLAARKAA